jgi:hypothetical protein
VAKETVVIEASRYNVEVIFYPVLQQAEKLVLRRDPVAFSRHINLRMHVEEAA